jgi:putative ubiquitin-RnfH superfamily antitoxin RatB of RatAB toxin-antitoxin module
MANPNAGRIDVEVCFALADAQTLLALEVDAGTTVGQAIEASGILRMHPEIDLGVHKVGVFAKLQPLDAVLNAHDRVEIYRSLKVDPKTARQRRVAKTRAGGTIEGRKWTRKEAR